MLLFYGSLLLGQNVEKVTVKTRAPSNKNVDFYFRIPEGYDAENGQLYRVLVYFGGRNCGGESEASGGVGFSQWADENKIFIVAPGFKDDDYWYPQKWSGKALLKGLELIKKQYKINDKRLMFYGY